MKNENALAIVSFIVSKTFLEGKNYLKHWPVWHLGAVANKHYLKANFQRNVFMTLNWVVGALFC